MGKKTIEIRVRATVEEGSVEEKLLAFLDDESATPLKKSEMWIKAAKMCWLSLALKYKQCPQEEIEESLYDCDYSWELHWEFLLNKARMKLARVRHRVSALNSSATEANSQVQLESCELDSNLLDSRRLTDNRMTNGDSHYRDELNQQDSLVVNEPIPSSFNLFGDSIISKQD